MTIVKITLAAAVIFVSLAWIVYRNAESEPVTSCLPAQRENAVDTRERLQRFLEEAALVTDWDRQSESRPGRSIRLVLGVERGLRGENPLRLVRLVRPIPYFRRATILPR